MGKEIFPRRRPLRAFLLLQWGIAILSLVLELVPLSGLAAASPASPQGAGGADGSLEKAGAGGQGKLEDGDDMPLFGSSDVEDETSTETPTTESTSPTIRTRIRKNPFLLATTIAVMLAVFGAAAHRLSRSGSSAENRIKSLVKLMPDVAGMADLVDTADAIVALKFFNGAVAAADKAQKREKEEGKRARRVSRKERQQKVDGHLGDSVSALRFMVKSAHDRADFLAKRAKTVLQPSLPAAEMVATERALLDHDFVDAYVIIKEGLEKSIKRHAKFAEKGATNLKNFPVVGLEEDASLLNRARRHMQYVKDEATTCTLAHDTMSIFTKQLVVAHREYHLNEDLETFSKIEELHAIMKAYKAIAVRALQQPSSLGNLVNPLKVFAEQVQALEGQFERVAKSFERLRTSDSTATNVDASTDLTTEATKFVELHEACAMKLTQVRTFFEGGHPAVVESGRVFKEAIETAYYGAKMDHDHMTKALSVLLAKKQAMLDGAVAGFTKPHLSPELLETVVGNFENLGPAIKAAMAEVRSCATGQVGKCVADDRKKLQDVTDARIKLATLRRDADQYSAAFVLLRSMENLIERSMRVHETVEAALKSSGRATPPKNIAEMMRRFNTAVGQAKKAQNLVEVAKAATRLRTLSDHLTAALYRLDVPS
ncbi:hypothetical protein Emed_004594 [Eimeria media]